MNFISFIHNRILTVSLIIMGVTVFLFGFSSNLSSETSQRNNADESKPISSPEKREPDHRTSAISSDTSSGYKVYIDPETGKFIDTPLEEEDISVTRGLGSSSVLEELLEEPAPGGGVMIVLPESYHYFSRAAIDGNGRLSTDCSKHNHAKNGDE
jgi:hypothetical protein